MAEARGRYGFETFDCAPALRLEAHEEMQQLQIAGLNARIDRLEALMEQLERRLWLTVYGVVAAILATAFKGLMPFAM